MKKTLVVLAVLFVALMTVSAAAKGDIVAGAKIGFDTNNMDVDGVSFKLSNVPFAVNGQYYVTDEVAAYAELSLNFANKLAMAGHDTGFDSALALGFSAGASYSYEIQKGINAIGSVGFGRKAFGFDQFGDNNTYSYWAIELSAAGTYQIDKKNGIDLIGGLKLAIPVSGLRNEAADDTLDISGVGFTPFFGATYAF